VVSVVARGLRGREFDAPAQRASCLVRREV